MCANHTRALTFNYCAAKSNEKGELNIPEKIRMNSERKASRAA